MIVSTRCINQNGRTAVKEYLDRYGIVVDDICSEKPPARVYIDDRAIRFDGHPETLLGQIQTFKPWWK